MSFDVELSGVTVRAHGALVLDRVDLRVPRASRYGFLGGNGAGKSTALRALLGLVRPATGRISLLGCADERARRDALARVGVLIESPSLYEHLTARENLAVWCAALRLPSSTRAARIDAVLDEVGLTHARDKRAGRYSLGMRQRLGLAIAFVGDPELLVLDEPTNGLDPTGTVAIRELLLRRNRERGTTLLVASHVLSEIERIATYVGVLRDGRLVHEGPYARGTDLEALYVGLEAAA